MGLAPGSARRDRFRWGRPVPGLASGNDRHPLRQERSETATAVLRHAFERAVAIGPSHDEHPSLVGHDHSGPDGQYRLRLARRGRGSHAPMWGGGPR
jgi:hypothetical protein